MKKQVPGECSDETQLEQIFEEEFGEPPPLSAEDARALEEATTSPEAMESRLHRLMLFLQSPVLTPEGRQRLLEDESEEILAHLGDVSPATRDAILRDLERLGLEGDEQDSE